MLTQVITFFIPSLKKVQYKNLYFIFYIYIGKSWETFQKVMLSVQFRSS